jgi:hypothetical protein
MNSVNSFKDLQGPQNQLAWLSPINFPRRNYKKFFGHKSMLDRGDYKKNIINPVSTLIKETREKHQDSSRRVTKLFFFGDSD